MHVAFVWSGNDPKINELKPIFDKAKDWMRYAPNCWIVRTDLSPQVWYSRLKPYIKEPESVFICELNITNRQGRLPKWMWDWIKKDRN